MSRLACYPHPIIEERKLTNIFVLFIRKNIEINIFIQLKFQGEIFSNWLSYCQFFSTKRLVKFTNLGPEVKQNLLFCLGYSIHFYQFICINKFVLEIKLNS
jgi:hypothetical protein